MVKRITKEKEKACVINFFSVLSTVQTLIVMVLCIVVIVFLSKANISTFLSLDLTTLCFAVIILGFILLVVGWASSHANTGLSWIVFQVSMVLLLIIEIAVCFGIADSSGIMSSIATKWESSDVQTLLDLQQDLGCCGLYNVTYLAVDPCPLGADQGCYQKLDYLISEIRLLTTSLMFLCFLFGFFVDLFGCAICFHPDKISVEERGLEETELTLEELEEYAEFKEPLPF